MADRAIGGEYPYVFVDGIYLKRSWGGEMASVSVLVAIGVSEDGYREIRRRTRVVGCFPDGESALMLVCARLRHIATKEWGTKRYLNMKHLYEMEKENELKREQEKDGNVA